MNEKKDRCPLTWFPFKHWSLLRPIIQGIFLTIVSSVCYYSIKLFCQDKQASRGRSTYALHDIQLKEMWLNAAVMSGILFRFWNGYFHVLSEEQSGGMELWVHTATCLSFHLSSSILTLSKLSAQLLWLSGGEPVDNVPVRFFSDVMLSLRHWFNKPWDMT